MDQTSDIIMLRCKKWFLTNGLLLNEMKTESLTFTLNSEIQTNSVKVLGITFDPTLTWEKHINIISCKLSKTVFLLKSLKQALSYKHVKTAYFSYFQSAVMYGLILWGNSSHVKKNFASKRWLLEP